MATAPPIDDAEERRLLQRLRAGDEAAFERLVMAMSGALLRVARSYVPSEPVAEEVLQDTWLGVLNGLDRFEGRSSVRSWIFSILLNQARTRGERERRTVPFATLGAREAAGDFTAVDADRFLPADAAQWPHHWATPPRRWSESPEQALEDAETLAVVRAAIAELPEIQRLTITMRDLEGWPAEEVCDVLELTQGNQRVLLHRARSKVRAALERYLT